MLLHNRTHFLLLLLIVGLSYHFAQALVMDKNNYYTQVETTQSTPCIPYDTTNAPYCSEIVSWQLDSQTYTDFGWNNEYAMEYYQNITSYVDFNSLATGNSDKCKSAIKRVACVRSFVKCIDGQTPRLQACRKTCETAAKACSISFDLVKSSCDESIKSVNCFDASSAPQIFKFHSILLLMVVLFGAALLV